jgi:hypothetical protein
MARHQAEARSARRLASAWHSVSARLRGRRARLMVVRHVAMALACPEETAAEVEAVAPLWAERPEATALLPKVAALPRAAEAAWLEVAWLEVAEARLLARSAAGVGREARRSAAVRTSAVEAAAVPAESRAAAAAEVRPRGAARAVGLRSAAECAAVAREAVAVLVAAAVPLPEAAGVLAAAVPLLAAVRVEAAEEEAAVRRRAAPGGAAARRGAVASVFRPDPALPWLGP